MMMIERLAGAKDKYAGTVANELIKDFQMATSYPPLERDAIDSQDLTEIVIGLSEKFVLERERANNKTEEELT
jgi:intracellular multiplication protein IcmO